MHKYPQEKLQELYEAGGIKAVMEYCGTKRSAASELLRARGIHKPREYKKQESTKFLDKAIIAAYKSGDHNKVRLLADQHRVKYGWIKFRALQLGIRPPRTTRDPIWSEREIELLEEFQGYSPDTIQRKLKHEGYIRTRCAIVGKIHRLGLDSARIEGYSASELARLLGLTDVNAVLRWIDSGWLIAEKRKYRNSHMEIDPGCWFIMPGDLQDFIIENPSCVDFVKIARNRQWFIEILTDKNLPRLPKRRKQNEANGE